MFPAVQAPQSTVVAADADVPQPAAEVVHRPLLPGVFRSGAWWSLPQLLFCVAMTVGRYRTKRAYLSGLGYRRRLAGRKARWHIR